MVVLCLTEEDHFCIGSQFLIELKNSKNFHIIPKIGVRLFDSLLSRKLSWIHIQVTPCIHPFSFRCLQMCEWFVRMLLYFLFSVVSLCYVTWFTAHLCLQLQWWSRDLFSLVSVCLQRVECVCACVWLVGGCVAVWGQTDDRWAPLLHSCDTNVLIVDPSQHSSASLAFVLLLVSYWSLTGLSLTHGEVSVVRITVWNAPYLHESQWIAGTSLAVVVLRDLGPLACCKANKDTNERLS